MKHFYMKLFQRLCSKIVGLTPFLLAFAGASNQQAAAYTANIQQKKWPFVRAHFQKKGSQFLYQARAGATTS
jgi:hypothetical protein